MFPFDSFPFNLLYIRILIFFQMKYSRLLYIFILIICSSVAYAMPPQLTPRLFANPPHRVIRTCCAFGSDLQLWIIPIWKYTAITSVEELGPHGYLGNSGEGNGIIYTMRGGFVDMGHLRDQADWTAFLYSRIEDAKGKGNFKIHLGKEGGAKDLNLNIPKDITIDDAVKLAGRIAYDLSVWHEIASWYGCSVIPFVPERYSSFSIEDPYSNLLGATLGMEAIKSNLPYEEAMTQLIKNTMETIGAVASQKETYMAMEAVRDIWWTRRVHLPNRKIMLVRQMGVYSCQQPWLIPGWSTNNLPSFDLNVPDKTDDGNSLNKFYELDFKLNFKFPVKEIFGKSKNRRATQLDFDQFITNINKEMELDKIN